MSRIILVFALLSCAYGFPSAKQHSGKSRSSKIVGGQETTIEKHPFQVSLVINDGQDNYLCGGSIISKRWILTAAHCLANVKNITIRTGSAQLFSGGTTYVSSTFKVHPSYTKSTHDYDVAAIYAPKDIVLNSSTVKIVTLPNAGTNVAAGTKTIVSGWGTTSEGGTTSTVLRDVTVPVIDRSKCNTYYQKISQTITSRMLCAGLDNGGKDSCQGDSGGPLIAPDGKQVGVVSFGYGCARPNYPGVYSDVSALRDWIKQNTGV